jgi:hypothetical protein
MESLKLYSSITTLPSGIAVASMNTDVKAGLFSQASSLIGREVKEDDFLYFAFKLCHVGKNNNRDIFLKEELLAMFEKTKGVKIPSWRTPVGEPIDYDHDFKFPAIVGDIYDSVFVENPDPSDDDRPYIKCAAVIYRGLYPDVAFKVQRGAQLGYARLSMEVKFKQAVQTHQGRVLRGLNFKGAALTRMPADENADITSVDNERIARAEDEAPSLATAAQKVKVGSSLVEVPQGYPITGSKS